MKLIFLNISMSSSFSFYFLIIDILYIQRVDGVMAKHWDAASK